MALIKSVIKPVTFLILEEEGWMAERKTTEKRKCDRNTEITNDSVRMTFQQ